MHVNALSQSREFEWFVENKVLIERLEQAAILKLTWADFLSWDWRLYGGPSDATSPQPPLGRLMENWINVKNATEIQFISYFVGQTKSYAMQINMSWKHFCSSFLTSGQNRTFCPDEKHHSALFYGEVILFAFFWTVYTLWLAKSYDTWQWLLNFVSQPSICFICDIVRFVFNYSSKMFHIWKNYKAI